MTHTTFVAFSSADTFVADAIGEACKTASSPEARFIPWNRHDTSGQPIDRSVYSWVENADALVADISEPNHNVTYEVGLALGTQRSLRLIRAGNKSRKLLEEIGLLHNIGHDDFNGHDQLVAILRRPYTTPPWPRPKRNSEQPVMSFSRLKPTTYYGAPSATSKKSCECAFAASIRRKSTG